MGQKKQIFITILFTSMLCSGFIFPQSTASRTTPVIAVLDFEPKGGVTSDAADFITERVRIELFKTGKYRVVERRDMAKIIEEQKLELSGLSGSAYASKVGKLLSAQKILLGTVNKLDNSYYLNARIIDVESGVMEFGDTIEASNSSSLSEASRSLVIKITGSSFDPSLSENEKKADVAEFITSTVSYFIGKIKGRFSGTNSQSDEEDLEEYTDEVKENRDEYEAQKTDKSNQDENRQESKSQPNNNVEQSKGESRGMGGFQIRYGFNPITIQNYDINGNFLILGGRGMFAANPYFGIGGAVYGGFLVNYPMDKFTVEMLYGGLTLDLSYRMDFVRFGVNCLLGLGGYGAVDSSKKQTDSSYEKDALVDYGAFLALEPGILIAFRVAPFMEIGITASYLLTSSIYKGNSSMNNLTAGLSFMFFTGK